MEKKITNHSTLKKNLNTGKEIFNEKIHYFWYLNKNLKKLPL